MLGALVLVMAAAAGATSPHNSTAWCAALLGAATLRYPDDATALGTGAGGISFSRKTHFMPDLLGLPTGALLGRVGHNKRGEPSFLGHAAQDLWLWHNHARFLPRRGFFVDLATNDPIIRSTTYFLEQCLGWTGLCIEPNPQHHARIRRERSCELVPRCISSSPGNVTFAVGSKRFGGSSQIASGIAKKAADAKSGQLSRFMEITVRCERLEAVLAARDVRHIDYLSLDIEGHEKVALSSWEPSKVSIDVIIAEDEAVSAMLAAPPLGYRQLEGRLGADSVLIRPGFKLGIERLGGQAVWPDARSKRKAKTKGKGKGRAGIAGRGGDRII